MARNPRIRSVFIFFSIPTPIEIADYYRDRLGLLAAPNRTIFSPYHTHGLNKKNLAANSKSVFIRMVHAVIKPEIIFFHECVIGPPSSRFPFLSFSSPARTTWQYLFAGISFGYRETPSLFAADRTQSSPRSLQLSGSRRQRFAAVS